MAPDGLGLRRGLDRRRKARRAPARAGTGRRRGDRRRARLRTALFTIAALAGPQTMKTTIQTALPALAVVAARPHVSVAIDEIRPLPPDRAYDTLIAEAGRVHGVDPDLIRAVMRAESGFNPTAVSPVGAQGLMQLMPALQQDMGVLDPFDPRQNIMGGAKYLRWLLDRHGGNIPLTLASYNAGPTTVARYGAIPPFKETRNYVKKITQMLEDAKAAD